MRATDLKPSRLKASPVETRDTEQCMCYVEMLALGRSYVGPIAPQGNSPEWDWTFFLPIDFQPTVAGGVVARLVVHNFMSRKQPQVSRPRRACASSTAAMHVLGCPPNIFFLW